MLKLTGKPILVLAGLGVALGGRLHRTDAEDGDPLAGFGAQDIESIASSRAMIWFQTAPGSAPATGVDLWHTADRGRTWQRGTGAQAVEAPLAFDAPADGLYGFYLVLHNTAGASAPPPEPGTAPQKWIRVDRSAPLVQVLELRLDDHFKVNREIHIRWTVQDDNLPDRPVRLCYRTEQTKTFRIIADLLAADSTYRWTVPEHVSGRIEVKVSAADRSGNIGRYTADWIRIEDSRIRGFEDSRIRGAEGLNDTGSRERGAAADAPERDAPAGALDPLNPRILESSNPYGAPLRLGHGDPPAAFKPVGREAAQRAEKLYDLGTWHRVRGEHALAIQRFREALKFDPDLLKAQCDLAGLLFLRGDHKAVERHYQRVLSRDPRHLTALKGLALLQARQRSYASARQTLQRLLLVSPEDAEAWLHLGDVTMFTGDRQAAREAWKKAGAIDNASAKVKQRAESRLTIYQGERVP